MISSISRPTRLSLRLVGRMRTRTFRPPARSARTTAEPTKPLAPVTSASSFASLVIRIEVPRRLSHTPKQSHQTVGRYGNGGAIHFIIILLSSYRIEFGHRRRATGVDGPHRQVAARGARRSNMPIATPLLDTIETPHDVRKLEPSQLSQLADELRAET